MTIQVRESGALHFPALAMRGNAASEVEFDALEAEFDALEAEVIAARSGRASLDLRIDDVVKDSINAAPEDPAITQDSRLTYTDDADSFLLKRITFESLYSNVYAIFGTIVATAPTKDTLADADDFVIADESASNARKRVPWLTLKFNIASALGWMVGTTTLKSTGLVDADKFLLSDSEASNASTHITWEGLRNQVYSVAGTVIATSPVKDALADADDFVIADESAANARKRVPWLDLKANIRTALGPSLIGAAGAKTSVADTDAFAIADSAASNATKRVTWETLRLSAYTLLGTIIATAPVKSMLADNDDFVIADEAAGNDRKRVPWSWLKANIQTALGSLVALSTAKTTLAEDDAFPIADSAASNATKHVKWAVIRGSVYELLGLVVATSDPKSTLTSADDFVIADSQAGNAHKRVSWSALISNVMTNLGPLTAALSAKSTPVDADDFLLADSAAANASKRVSWAQVKTTLGIEQSLDEMTDYLDGVAASVRAEVEDLPFSLRPGRDPRLFAFIPTEGLSDAQVTAAMMGTLEAFDPLPDSMIVIDGQDGAEARVTGPTTGPGVIVLREAFRIDTDGLYKVTGKVRRRVNATDPANDSVQIGVLGLNATQGAAVGSPMIMDTLNTLTVASGRVSSTDVIATAAAAGVTLVAPAGTVYGRLYARFWGTTGTTALQTLTVHDIAGSTYNSPDVSALEAELDALVSEDLPTRVEALETASTAPEIARFKTRPNAAAATVGATVDLIEVLGNSADTDGHIDTYQRAVGGPAGAEVFQSADGAWWQRQYHSRFADFASLANVVGAAVPAWQNEAIVMRRDAASLAAPFLMRNAGLSDPGHAFKAATADGRYFEYAPDKVIDMTQIGASTTRTGAQNTAYYNEAVAYSLLRGKVPIFWPTGIYETAGLSQTPDTTTTGKLAVPVIGAGQQQTILRLANGANASSMNFSGVGTLHLEGVTVCNLTIDGNRANQTTTSHGLRGSYLKDCLVRDVTITDTYTYGIGFETGDSFQDVLFDHVTVIRSGADSFDMKNNTDSNRGIKFSNVTVREPNQLNAPDEAAIDIRSQAELSNIVVHGPFPNDCIGIRFKHGDTPASDYGGPRSSLTNFFIYNPDGEGIGVQVLHNNVNISNGVIVGCTHGLHAVGKHLSVTNVQSLDAGDTGILIAGQQGRYFGCRAISPGAQGVKTGATSCGNQFFGCELIGGGIRDLTVSAPNEAYCVAQTNITLSGEQTIDFVTTAASRVIVMGQTNKTQNGVYISAAGAWTRDATADSIAELTGFAAKITAGHHHTGKWFRCINNANTDIPVGVAEIEFAEAGENKFFGGVMGPIIYGTSEMRGVTGFRNEMRGTVTLAVGQSNVVIFHHMGVAPTQVVLTPMSPLGDISKWWVDPAVNNRYFYVMADVVASTAINFAWTAYA